jgi:hypothetical protein
MLDSRFCVVLRTAGERTAELAEQLLREQCETLHVLRVAPFAEAVRQCYRIAIESGAPWLLTCDADVLVAPDMADQVQRIAQRMPGSAWQAIGYVDDKLAGCARLGGLRLHRASELAGLIDRIADSVRPEADLCRLRPNWQRVRIVLGRHDFEQWYRDLHRKGAVHRGKHSSWGASIVPRWRASKDRDLQAALRGWDGLGLPDWAEKEPM